MNRKRSSPSSRTASKIGVGVMAALGILLAGLVVTHTGTAFLARSRPALALAIEPEEPLAHYTVAQATLDKALDAALKRQREEKKAGASAVDRAPAGSATESTSASAGGSTGASDEAVYRSVLDPKGETAKVIAEHAKRALLAAPFEARALRLLAQLADVEGDVDRKRKLLEAIVRRTKDEPLATYWLMLDAFQQSDRKALLHYADLMLSKHTNFDPVVVPVMVRSVEAGHGADELKARLVENPPWRPRFFRELPRAIADERTPLDLLLAIKTSPSPPTWKEIGSYLDLLVSRKQYGLGYYAWLQLIEAEKLAKLVVVNNGGFEDRPEPVPFDWSIPSSSGSISAIGIPPGESGRALGVTFVGPGRVELQPVQQMLVLAPGRYRLSVRQKGDVSGRRGVHWTVTCDDTQTRIGETPMLLGSVPEWAEVSTELSVPDGGCQGQALRLVLAARSPSEQIVKGDAWFDDVRITRADIP